MATPVFGSSATVDGYGVTGLAVPKPANLVSGQGLLIFLTTESTAPIEPPAGFTELGSGAITAVAPAPDNVPLSLHCFAKRAGGSEDAVYSFNWSGACYARAASARFSGIAPSGQFVDVFASAAKSVVDGATPNVAVTTTGPNRLLVWAGANLYGGTWTRPAGFTAVYNGAETLHVGAAEQAAAGASGNKSGTCTPMYSCGFLVALSDTTIGGGGGPSYNAGLLPILM